MSNLEDAALFSPRPTACTSIQSGLWGNARELSWLKHWVSECCREVKDSSTVFFQTACVTSSGKDGAELFSHALHPKGGGRCQSMGQAEAAQRRRDQPGLRATRETRLGFTSPRRHLLVVWLWVSYFISLHSSFPTASFKIDDGSGTLGIINLKCLVHKRCWTSIAKHLTRARYTTSRTECATRTPETSFFMLLEGNGPFHATWLLVKVAQNSILTGTQPSLAGLFGHAP